MNLTKTTLSLLAVSMTCILTLPGTSHAGRRVCVPQQTCLPVARHCQTTGVAAQPVMSFDLTAKRLHEVRENEKVLQETVAKANDELTELKAQLAAMTAENEKLNASLAAANKLSAQQQQQIAELKAKSALQATALAAEQDSRKKAEVASQQLKTEAVAYQAKAEQQLAATQAELKQTQADLVKVTASLQSQQEAVTQLQAENKTLKESAMKSEEPKVEGGSPAAENSNGDAPPAPSQPEQAAESSTT